jgi:ABC-type spermidine/putrescine transport system permease subunit I
MWEEFFSNRDWPMAASLAWLLLMVLVVLPVFVRAAVRAAGSPVRDGSARG